MNLWEMPKPERPLLVQCVLCDGTGRDDADPQQPCVLCKGEKLLEIGVTIGELSDLYLRVELLTIRSERDAAEHRKLVNLEIRP